jgi:hypothetical protein
MSQANEDPSYAFWRWFEDNEEQLFALEGDREALFDALSSRLSAVHTDLTFEIGPDVEGMRDLVISAGGISRAFPAVVELTNAAPELPRWRVIAFRPRRSPIHDLTFGDVSVRAEDVRFAAVPDGDRLGLVLLLPGFRETPDETFEQMAYLFLDEALGELDVETLVGFIEVQAPTGDALTHSTPLSTLPDTVDRWRKTARG